MEEAEFHVEWEGALVASVVSSSVYTVLCSMYTQWCIACIHRVYSGVYTVVYSVYTQWYIACIHSGV